MREAHIFITIRVHITTEILKRGHVFFWIYIKLIRDLSVKFDTRDDEFEINEIQNYKFQLFFDLNNIKQNLRNNITYNYHQSILIYLYRDIKLHLYIYIKLYLYKCKYKVYIYIIYLIISTIIIYIYIYTH